MNKKHKEVLAILSISPKELKQRKISFTKLTERTRKRAEAIDAFQEGDASVSSLA